MDQKDNREELKTPERKISATEQAVSFGKDAEKKVEQKESSPYENVVTEELKREIEKMHFDENLKGEAKAKADKIEFLGEKEKIEHLLKIAHEKGVIYAINVAKAMNDPYILDTLHDILVKEGLYKQFI